MPTCNRCRHMVLTYESVPELDATLEATFRAELVHRASVEKSRLSQFYSQSGRSNAILIYLKMG